MQEISSSSRRQFVVSAASAAALAIFPAHATTEETPVTKGGIMPTPTLTPYLLLDGCCAQAMEFYRSVLGGELSLTKVKDSPARGQMPSFQQEKVLNAKLKSRIAEISASDWLRPDKSPIRGNTVCLFLSGGTAQELKSLFAKLSQGAEVTDPLKEQFFGLYGALNDRFGVRWMFVTSVQNG